MADYLVTDTELTSVADAIRTKTGGNGTLSWPTGFASAIGSLLNGDHATHVTVTIYCVAQGACNECYGTYDVANAYQSSGLSMAAFTQDVYATNTANTGVITVSCDLSGNTDSIYLSSAEGAGHTLTLNCTIRPVVIEVDDLRSVAPVISVLCETV